MNIGEYAYFLVDVDHPAKGYNPAVISDFKMYPGRRKGDELQYVQFATLTTTTKKGALVDKNGKVIGLLLTQEKNINLAVPIQDVEKMIKGQKAVPVSDLKNTKQTSEALHYYVQAIFAEDAQKLDQAIDLYKRAIESNPDLESAHLALGPIYYRKQLYEEEAKEYEAVLRVNPNNADALASYAASLETRGFYKQAIEVYKKAIAADPEEQSNYYNLGIAYIADGQPKKAMEVYPQLKAMSPGDAELLRRLATGGK
jgi:tetratricopeptide (TPR) repeat protein